MASVYSAPARTKSPSTLSMLREHWGWFALITGILVMMVLLGPILAPFAIAATFAYMGDPLGRSPGKRIGCRAPSASAWCSSWSPP